MVETSPRKAGCSMRTRRPRQTPPRLALVVAVLDVAGPTGIGDIDEWRP
jgi:hypothetical protein